MSRLDNILFDILFSFTLQYLSILLAEGKCIYNDIYIYIYIYVCVCVCVWIKRVGERII